MLQTDHIDLYYQVGMAGYISLWTQLNFDGQQHRVDPAVPIEVVLEALRPFVEGGQIKWLGLSECSAATLRRAKAVPGIGEKIVACQVSSPV
jgi:aryl-alcohol dehydrogenase-like predicted oxidoreductase